KEGKGKSCAEIGLKIHKIHNDKKYFIVEFETK
ncbi:MAG: hypothetical protein RLZZ417_1701, partial [Bacteroidota bacterium]